jgi:hypothetical protein
MFVFIYKCAKMLFKVAATSRQQQQEQEQEQKQKQKEA